MKSNRRFITFIQFILHHKRCILRIANSDYLDEVFVDVIYNLQRHVGLQPQVVVDFQQRIDVLIKTNMICRVEAEAEKKNCLNILNLKLL